MVFDIGLGWGTSIILCSLRLGVMLSLTPLLSGFGLPRHIRVFLVLAFAVALVSVLPLAKPPTAQTSLPFMLSALSEVATGALLGFGAACAFAAFTFAGNLLDQQLGFGLANVFDPTTKSQSPLVASLFGTVAIVMFFTTDAHHALLRGFAFSLERQPLGSSILAAPPSILAHQFGLIFSLGLMFAAPVLFCIFLIEVGLAVISRSLPQMNVFMISIPVKIACGLLLLATLMPLLGPVFKRVFASIFLFWKTVL
ncbi:MAG: flagellar biosynthetic protein FliR [Burkholderiales bacterium]|nr:flagellar biosynthetic protein FliR [Burkholderiales bacterium]